VGAAICWLLAGIAVAIAQRMKSRGGRTHSVLDALPEDRRYLGLYGVAAVALCLGIAALFTDA
jgi:hypothetical protein